MQVLVEFTVRSGIGFSFFENEVTNSLKAVFQIRDILVRIRILGSVPLTNGSGCGSVPTSSAFKDTKKNFLIFFYVLIMKFKSFKIVKICLTIKVY
jgi:hypothetical protein